MNFHRFSLITITFFLVTCLGLVKAFPALANADEGSVEVEAIIKKVGVELVEFESLDREVRKDSQKGENHTFVCTFQGQIAMPNDCKKYHICSRSGVNSTSGVCIGEQKRFHHQMRTCKKMTENECKATMCQSVNDKFPDPYLKENYLICKEMVPEVQKCGDGLIFDEEQKTCVSGSPLAGMKESFETEVENPTPTSDIKKVRTRNTDRVCSNGEMCNV